MTHVRTKPLQWLLTVTVALMAFAHTSRAEETCQAPAADCVAVGHWNFGVSLGAGIRTNPIRDAKNIPLVVIPYLSYYGKHLFIDDLDFGVTFLEQNEHTLSLVASPGYDRVYFYRSDLQNIFVGELSGAEIAAPGLPPPPSYPRPFPHRTRAFTYLAGPEWTYKHEQLTAQLDVLHDVTGHDHGTEVRGALKFPLLQGHGTLSGSVGLTWKSASIVNYYYGAPGFYEGGSAFNPFVKLGYTVPLSRKWRLAALVHLERLSDSIAHSPIVADHYVETAFIGATYTW
jgi:MipA family protein